MCAYDPCTTARSMPEAQRSRVPREWGSFSPRALGILTHPIGGVWRYGEGSTNSNIDLDSLPPLHLGSGRAFWGHADVLTEAGAEVKASKRDGKNAFRQINTAPLDWWMSFLVCPDYELWRQSGEHIAFPRLLEPCR